MILKIYSGVKLFSKTQYFYILQWGPTRNMCVNILRPRQHCRFFPDGILKCILWMKILELWFKFQCNLYPIAHEPLARYINCKLCMHPERFPCNRNYELTIPACIMVRGWPLSVRKSMGILQWLPPYREVWQCPYHLGPIPRTTQSFLIQDHSWPTVSWLFFLIMRNEPPNTNISYKYADWM